jgi:hypothetical protein
VTPQNSDLAYFRRLAFELDALVSGTTFLFTWHLDEFDERFRNAVVILIGDEKQQIPSYAHLTRAIFKTGGTKPNPIRDTLRLSPAVGWRVLMRDLRNQSQAWWRRRGREHLSTPIFEIPLGYFALTDVRHIPVAERLTDVFFAGSIETNGGFTLRPRLVARREMLAALAQACERMPELRVDCTNWGPFANPDRMLSPQHYSQRLMQAKIVLCPRGNFDETFRVAEAARSGCVAIVERLPNRWYNQNSPAIQLDRWSALPDVLAMLRSDPDALAGRAEQMRRWWRDSMSEQTVARFIAKSLPKSA